MVVREESAGWQLHAGSQNEPRFMDGAAGTCVHTEFLEIYTIPVINHRGSQDWAEQLVNRGHGKRYI